MITFKQFIAEVADKIVPYEVTAATERRFKAEATIAGRKIRLICALASEEHDQWDVEFEEEPPDGRWSVNAKGSGGEFEVAGFITSALREFITRYEPSMMSFSAAKGSGKNQSGMDDTRSNVYLKILQRKFSDFDVQERDKGVATVFVLRRLD